MKKDTIEVFIPNTDLRYSITENGIVFSNWRYNTNGLKIFQKKQIKRFLNGKNCETLTVKMQFGKYSKKNKMKTIHVNTLMIECFSLTPPDQYHLYKLRFKDDNCWNASLSNFEWKIYTHSSLNVKFYPQPFYNLNGEITHKTCDKCGVKKEIINFKLQNSKGCSRKTYRNSCTNCRCKSQWKSLKNDPVRLQKHKLQTKKWSHSLSGNNYRKEYVKKMGLIERKNLYPHYLATSLRMSIGDLTPQLISLSRKRILLKRTIKNQKHEKAN